MTGVRAKLDKIAVRLALTKVVVIERGSASAKSVTERAGRPNATNPRQQLCLRQRQTRN